MAQLKSTTVYGALKVTSDVNLLSNLSVNGTLVNNGDTVYSDGYHPVADKWTTARTITLDGDIVGSVAIDGSSDVTIETSVNGGSVDNAVEAEHALEADKLTTPVDIELTGDITGSASFDGSSNITISTSVSGGSVESADKWTTPRTITLGGDLSGSVSLDGSGDVTLDATLIGGVDSQFAATSYADIVTKLPGVASTGVMSVGNVIDMYATNATESSVKLTATTDTLTVTGDVIATGNMGAYSDRRLKTNITHIDDALSKVQKLNGCLFDRIDTGQRQTGLIAQDVREVLPEATNVNPEGYISVSYGNLVGLLVEAIKEQQVEIEQLKANQNTTIWDKLKRCFK